MGRTTCSALLHRPQPGQRLATYMAANMPESKIAVIYRNDDDALLPGHPRHLCFRGRRARTPEIVYEGTFNQATRPTSPCSSPALRLPGPTSSSCPSTTSPLPSSLAQAKAQWATPPFGVDGMDGILALDNFDLGLAERRHGADPFSADAEDELTQSFVAEYTARCGETPNQFAADAYDVIYALKAALEAQAARPTCPPRSCATR